MRNVTHWAFILACAVVPLDGAVAGGYSFTNTETKVVMPPANDMAMGWTGFYAGLSVAWASVGDDRVGIRSATGVKQPGPGTLRLSGPGGGLHAGFRWETRLLGQKAVLGPEISYERSSADDAVATSGVSASTSLDNVWSAKFKAGTLSESRKTLFYGSLGAAHGEFDYAVQGSGMDYDGQYSDTAWTMGVGVEHKISPEISLFGEWELRQFGKTSLRDSMGNTTEATPRHHELRVGVNVAF